MSEPTFFRPHVLRQRGRKLQPNAPWTKAEAFIVSDNSMPARDWSLYDWPTYQRMKMAPRYRDQVLTSPIEREPFYIIRQAG